MEIEWRFAVPPGVNVPVVIVSHDAARRYGVMNLNQVNSPKQFLNPTLCTTTSGLLNYIGALDVLDTEMLVIANLNALQDTGIDEWFRWFYCLTETGVVLDTSKLLVRGADGEKWIYDYDGSQP